jgi:hypothetical protein
MENDALFFSSELRESDPRKIKTVKNETVRL